MHSPYVQRHSVGVTSLAITTKHMCVSKEPYHMWTSASVNLYTPQAVSDGRGAVNLGFEDEGDSVKWKKNGEDRRRSSSKKVLGALNGGGGCIYEGTSLDNDGFGEKPREESIVVIQVTYLWHSAHPSVLGSCS